MILTPAGECQCITRFQFLGVVSQRMLRGPLASLGCRGEGSDHALSREPTDARQQLKDQAGPARSGELEAELGHPKDERDGGDCKTTFSWGVTPQVSLRHRS